MPVESGLDHLLQGFDGSAQIQVELKTASASAWTAGQAKAWTPGPRQCGFCLCLPWQFKPADLVKLY